MKATNATQPTATERVSAYLEVAKAIAEAMRELKEVPQGRLYARLMGHMSLEVFNDIIATLVRAGLVRSDGWLLRWVEKTGTVAK